MMPNMMQGRATPAAVVAQYQQQQAYEQVQAHYEQQQQQQQQPYESVQHHYDQNQQTQYNHLHQYDQQQSNQQQFDPATMPPQQFDAQYTSALDAAAEDFSLPSQQDGMAKVPNKRKGAFRAEHAIKYGLKVVSSSSPVTKVQCLFCVHYGREVSPDDTKRKMNVKGVKYWTPPFRTDHYAMHHDLQHKIMFQHYENCSAQERLHFFEPDTVHRLRHMVPKAQAPGEDIAAKAKDARVAKRAKPAPTRADPSPTKQSLDPFKMMLPPMEIPQEMQTLVDIYVGHNYTPLDDKWKSLTIIASLVAQHVRNGFLETHIRRALLSGASKSEIIQVIMQSASFIGLPKTMDAMKIAHEVFLQGHPDAQNQNTVFL